MRPPRRGFIGAGRRIRTDDLLITNQLLYQLSYAGKKLRGKLAQSLDLNNVRLTPGKT